MEKKILLVKRYLESFVQIEQAEDKEEGISVVFHDWGGRSCTSTLLNEREVEELVENLTKALLAAEEIKDYRDGIYVKSEEYEEYIKGKRKELTDAKKELYSLIDRVVERYLS